MKKMRLLIVVVVLAAVSFGGAFGLSRFVNGRKAQPVAGAATTNQADEVQRDEAAAPAVGASERQADELAKELSGKIELVKHREQELDLREKRLAAAQELLKKQAQELENLRLELTAPLTRLKEAKADLERSQIAITEVEKANLKKLASIYEVDVSSGSRIIQGMCANKQEEDAARILHFMTPRGAAKLLAEVQDKDLAARLCDKLKKVKEETRKEG